MTDPSSGRCPIASCTEGRTIRVPLLSGIRLHTSQPQFEPGGFGGSGTCPAGFDDIAALCRTVDIEDIFQFVSESDLIETIPAIAGKVESGLRIGEE